MKHSTLISPAAIVGILLGCSLLTGWRAGAQERREPPDNPAARAAWFLRGRQSPDRQPAAAHRLRALLQRTSIRRAARHGAAAANFNPTGSGAWQALGPQPMSTSGSMLGGYPSEDTGAVSGRVTAIAVDASDPTGNTVYVGAAYGGVWKSTNALGPAPTFAPLTDSAVTLSVGAIAVDASTSPPTIFVGTGEPNNTADTYYGEGILESADGGTTWTQVSSADAGATSFIGAGFSRILFDAVNPKIVLAAVSDLTAGDPQAYAVGGIYRSTDHGATWSSVLSAGTDSSATDLTYDPATTTYYAAISGQGIYKSSNAGASWTALSSPFAAGVPANEVVGAKVEFFRAALATRNGTLYALMATQDGGLATPTPCTSANSPNCDTGLVQSSNGGQSWSPIPVPDVSTAPAGSEFATLFCYASGYNGAASCQGNYDQDIAAPTGGGGLVVGGQDLWSASAIPAMTADGTSTAWSDLTDYYAAAAGMVHTDQHVITAINSNTWFIGNDGGVWSTTSAGTGWTNLNATLGTIQFYSVAADQQASGVWMGGSQDNGTAKLTGPGLQWTRFEEGDGGFTATNSAHPLQYFTEYNGVGVYRSDNAGGDMNNNPTDVVDSTIIADTAAFYVPYIVMPAPDTATILLGTCRVWGGPDGNTSAPVAGTGGWFAYSPDLTTGGSGSGACADSNDYITDVASAPSNPDIAWAVTDDGQAQMTQNLTRATPASPAAWVNVTGSLPSSDATPFSSVAINPINPQVVYVGVQGFGSGHVFKTSDGGGTWTNITGNLPDAPVNWILIDPQGPDNDIYVASDVGVFAATDGGVAGERWEQVGGGLPASAVLQLGISPASWSTRTLVAATHGRGMWTIAPLPTPDFTLAASPAAVSVLAGTAAQFTIMANGENGEAGPISYVCRAPSSGCSVTPGAAAPGTAATVTLAPGAVLAGANAVTVDATNEAGVSHTLTQTVTGMGFTLAAAPAAQTLLAGAAASFTVQATGATGFSGTIALACTAPATGCTVTPASVAAGATAEVSVAAAQLPLGRQTVTITGSSGGASASASGTITVQGFTLSASTKAPAVLAGTPAVFTLAVAPENGFAGSVALACAQPASGCSFNPATVAAGSTSTLTVSGLGVGTDSVTVSGSGGSGAAVDASGSVTVQDFTVAASSSSATASPGQSAAYGLTLTAEAGFSGAVNLACGGAPAEATCAVAPATVTPNSTGVAATVTVTTTAASASLPPGSGGRERPGAVWFWLLGASLLAGLTVPQLRRRRFRLISMGLLGLVLLASACGGGSAPPPPPPPINNPGTPAGTYTLGVTAASGTLSHTLSVTLTVP